ncbi:MAG: hypothetical protein AB7I18_10195 [Candidatus Berkiella sp.]
MKKKIVTLTVPLELQADSKTNVLASILSKANGKRIDGLFHTNQPHSVAALVATLKGYPKGRIYCLASPIECHADHKTVYIVNQATLTNQQELSIVETLNAFLQQDGIRLDIVGEGLWLFTMEHHTDVKFVTPHSLWGKSMASHLPTGQDAVYWRRLLTECQMILSQTLSVWFWGNGIDNVALECDFDVLYTDDLILRSKAMNAKITTQPLIDCWSDAPLKTGNKLCFTPNSTQCEAFEQQWLLPLLKALKSGEISALQLITQEKNQYTLLHRHLYYFWRKTQPLTAFLDNGLMSFNEY